MGLSPDRFHSKTKVFKCGEGGGGGGVSLCWYGFTTTYATSTNVVCSNPAYGKVYSIQYYVISFVSNMGQVGSFPPPIKLTATI